MKMMLAEMLIFFLVNLVADKEKTCQDYCHP